MLTIPDLQAKIDALDVEIAGLKTERATHALAALREDKTAQKALSGIDAKVQGLLNNRQTLIDGIAGLEAEANVQRTESERIVRLAKADRIDAAVIQRVDANERLDSAMAELTASIIGWIDADRALAAVGVGDRGMRIYQALSGGIWYQFQTHFTADFRNAWTRELMQAFPMNSITRPQPITSEHGAINGRTLSTELRK